LAARRPGFVEITCCDVASFKSWSADELWTVVDTIGAASERVAAGTMTRARYHDLEMATGINYNPDGLLADLTLRPLLRPTDILTWDWVHSMLQDGTLTVELELMLQATAPLGVTRESIHEFLKDESWVFPSWAKTKSKQLHRVFDDHRVGEDPDKVKCSCAELLGLYGLLRLFFELRTGGVEEVRPALQSFLHCCEILDLLMQAKRCLANVDDVARVLDRALSEHLRLHIAAHGTGYVKPKHHWMADVSSQLRRDKCVLDAFIIERRHLAVKRVAEHVKNTSCYERSVLSSLVVADFANEYSSFHGLLGPTAALPWLPGFLVADKMSIFGFDVVVGEVVMRGSEVGEVAACCVDEARSLQTIVKVYRQVARVASHCVRCAKSEQLVVWLAAELAHCTAWRHRADGNVDVLFT
jgi:hypothetical protein